MGRVPLAVIGAGGLGREVAWLIEDLNSERDTYEFIGFIDDEVKSTPEGYPILGTLRDWLNRENSEVRLVCALGEPRTRYRVSRLLREKGYQFPVIVHPSVLRSRRVEIGEGSIVAAGSILTTNIVLGEFSLVNKHCTVAHDSTLESYASIMSGVRIAGEVVLETGAYLGTGVVTVQRVRVGAWSIVGAGAAVVSDLPKRVVAVGVPARPIKSLDDATD